MLKAQKKYNKSVKKALTDNGFNILEIKTEGDWVAIVCNKG